MARPFLFGTNFKMNQTPAESAAFYRQLATSIQDSPGVHLFVIPPYTSLGAVFEVAGERPHRIWVGAQNVHWAPEGAYTGEISVGMLLALANLDALPTQVPDTPSDVETSMRPTSSSTGRCWRPSQLGCASCSPLARPPRSDHSASAERACCGN